MAPVAKSSALQSAFKHADVHYTVLIRLPFPRGDFVDPPSMVGWNPGKDQELWDLLFRASAKGHDLDWQALAKRFNISLAFLSQQAAWLYENQLSQVRAQLQKANKPSPLGTRLIREPNSGSDTASGPSMARECSGVSSAVPYEPREQIGSHGEESVVLRRAVRGYPLSRNASAKTITQMTDFSTPTSARSSVESRSCPDSRRESREVPRRSIEGLTKQRRSSIQIAVTASIIAGDLDSSTSPESDASHSIARSRAFTHRPYYTSRKALLNPLSDTYEDEDESPPFLSMPQATAGTPYPGTDPHMTINISPGRSPSRRHSPVTAAKSKIAAAPASHTSYSSSSSTQSQPQSQNRSPIPLSALSPRQRRIAREGSDGTPSMGSSFSDLDDASVTQSALEEALANEMTQGGGASRFSTISQALRSRYL